MSSSNTKLAQPFRFIDRCVVFVVLVVIVAMAAGYAGDWHWFPELFSHFQLQYACVLAALLVIESLRKRWRRTTLVITVCLGWIMLRLATLWVAPTTPNAGKPQPEPAEKREVRVMSVNLFVGNAEYDKAAQSILDADADIVSLQEVTPLWATELTDRLRHKYPYSQLATQTDAFGIAVFSRHPLTAHVVQTEGIPWIEADVTLTDQDTRHIRPQFRFIAAHTLPPRGRHYAEARNKQLRSIADFAARARSDDLPVVLAGDLNCTRWSPYFRQMTTTAQLRSARVGFGLVTTWPADQWLLRIPIDHVLVSSRIGVADFRTGRRTGSDHLPLIVDLTL